MECWRPIKMRFSCLHLCYKYFYELSIHTFSSFLYQLLTFERFSDYNEQIAEHGWFMQLNLCAAPFKTLLQVSNLERIIWAGAPWKVTKAPWFLTIFLCWMIKSLLQVGIIWTLQLSLLTHFINTCSTTIFLLVIFISKQGYQA